jgi:excisionase family DNA binding protein
MPPNEKLYTSHQVAELLQMDPSSVVKWEKEKLLPAFRTPGQHRRFRQSDLVAFLKTHGMYIPPELGGVKKKVLLVDDDTSFLSAMKRAMKSYADRVDLITAESGIDALVMVGSKKPDVLVLDVSMPEMDGLEVLAKLKDSPDTRAIEVVVVTGKPSTEVEKKALALGAIAFRTKPISAGELADIVSPGRTARPS